MSDLSQSQSKQTFYVYAPDYKDEGTLERRYAVRSQHLEVIQKIIAAGVIRFGGVLLDPESKPTEADPRLRIIGSTMVVEAESIEKVKELIESDIYYTTGVWDRDNLVIVPFIPATSLP